MDNGFFYLLAVLCLVMLSVSMLRRSHQRRATSRDLTREQRARLRDQSQIRQSMEELLLQLEEVSRRINAQVDTKFVKLETVIKDADARIAHLQQLTSAAAPNGPHTAAVQRSPSPAPVVTHHPQSENRAPSRHRRPATTSAAEYTSWRTLVRPR